MDPVPVILDISSDEETGLGEPRGSGGGGGGLDWLSELLGCADDKEPGDYSDDVVVVGEVVNAKRKSKPLKLSLRAADDDCVVLEGDPDDPVAVVDEETGGSDELLIVGEKGQIACRDYPHPRHLCAKFPFSSTPHDRHCEQCHCFVCESLAPCLHWVVSISNAGHCHASDKEEIWKIQRKTFKLGKNAPLLPFKSPGASLPTVLSRIKQAQPPNIIQLAPDPMPQNQVSRPNVIGACSTLTPYSVPNIISQGRSTLSMSVPAKNRFHSSLVSQHLLGVRNNVTQRDRNMSIGNWGPGFAPSHKMFKRVGAVRGALPMHPSVSGSSGDINCAHAIQDTRSGTPATSTNDRNLFRWPNVSPSINLESYGPQDSSLLNSGSFITNTVPSQPQINTQPMAQSNDSQNFCPNDRENYCPHGYHGQNARQGIYQNGNQSLCQPGSQNQGVTDAGFSDFSLPVDSCLSNRHLPIENSQLHCRQSTYDPNPVEEFNSQLRPEIIESTGSLCEPSPIKEANCESAENLNPSLVDFEFENWLLENHPVPVVSDGSVSEMNLFSHETSLIDTGMLLFDFETSWNGLAHA